MAPDWVRGSRAVVGALRLDPWRGSHHAPAVDEQAAAAGGTAARARALTLRGRLNLLVALCVVPLLALTVAGNYVEYRTARRAAQNQAQAEARSFADDVARMLQSEVAALQTLALSAGLHEPNLSGFDAKAEAFLALRGSPAELRVIDGDGALLFSTSDSALPPEREVVRRVFESGRATISDLHAGATPGRWTVALEVPVMREGRMFRDLELLLEIAAFGPVVGAQVPPPDWGLVIADGSGRVMAHRPPGRPGIGELLTPEALAAMATEAEGSVPGQRTDGTRLQLVFAVIPGSNWIAGPWHVMLGIPESLLLAPLLRSAAGALLGGTLLLLAGLSLAGVVARGIVRPIARLQRLAAEPVTAAPLPTGLPETDVVAVALHDAAVAQQDALRRLRTLADTLESRVVEEVAARQAAQAQAAHGERLQALGRLASGIAHDFNNVLQTVGVAATLLEMRGGDAATIERVTRLLTRAGRQGSAITGRLLGVARQRPAASAVPPILLGPVLAEIAELLPATLEGDVTVALEVAPSLPSVAVDRSELETVLMNLAANARDAMARGGRVVLRAQPADGAAPAGLPAGRYVALSVADAGVGMTAEVLARVSEPFFTTKPAGRGTGLGLALARGFAERVGGSLQIESEPGQGTTVTLWLPARET